MCWGLSVGGVFAYELVVTDVPEPYAIVPVAADEYNKQVQLGVLEGFPVMYEVRSLESFELSLQLSTVPSRVPENAAFSLMIVRVNEDDSGVTEMARVMAGDTDWVTRKDPVFGLTFKEGEVYQREYEPGVYRIEVSTPENEGRYMLSFGSTADHLNYWQTLERVYQTQRHFGYSVVQLLASSYVYYPLGILFLLFIINRTWKYRKTITHAT